MQRGNEAAALSVMDLKHKSGRQLWAAGRGLMFLLTASHDRQCARQPFNRLPAQAGLKQLTLWPQSGKQNQPIGEWRVAARRCQHYAGEAESGT
jgi:hypothetical protein